MENNNSVSPDESGVKPVGFQQIVSSILADCRRDALMALECAEEIKEIEADDERFHQARMDEEGEADSRFWQQFMSAESDYLGGW